MVRCFTHQGVYEIGATKSARHQGVNALPVGRIDLHVLAHMREDVRVSHGDESQLAKVAVGGKVFPAMSKFAHWPVVSKLTACAKLGQAVRKPGTGRPCFHSSCTVVHSECISRGCGGQATWRCPNVCPLRMSDIVRRLPTSSDVVLHAIAARQL